MELPRASAFYLVNRKVERQIASEGGCIEPQFLSRAMGMKQLAFVFVLVWSVAPGLAQSVDENDPANHGQGLIPATEKDLKGVPVTPKYRDFLPERVDLSARFPIPGNQGPLASCVGWAVGYAARSYYAKTAEGRDVGDNSNVPSPSYIYGSILKDNEPCDAGSKIPDALKLLRTGALSLRQFPYSSRQCSPPSAAQQASATDFQITGFSLVNYRDLDQVKSELAQGNPVVIGMTVSQAFHRLRGDQIYRRSDVAGEGHAITVVGYDEAKQAFKLINSWGQNWGLRGFAWIEYEMFRSAVYEAYVMRVAGAAPKPQPQPSPEVVVSLPQPPVVSELDCAQVRAVSEGGKRTLVGFVGHDEDLERVRAAAAGDEIRVVVRPWPQCEALLTLDKPLSRSDRPIVSIRRTSGDSLTAGDHLVMDIETPPYPSYLHVAYFQTDGSVLNLMQPGVGSFQAYRPHSRITIGDSSEGTKFRIGPPFGREMLIVLAGHSPIFPEARPKQETERDFLTALRRALIWKPEPTASDRDVVAAFDAIITKDRAIP
jgi:hypothetical protein